MLGFFFFFNDLTILKKRVVIHEIPISEKQGQKDSLWNQRPEDSFNSATY